MAIADDVESDRDAYMKNICRGDADIEVDYMVNYEFHSHVDSIIDAIQDRKLEVAAYELSCLEAMRSNGWTELSWKYKFDLEWEICRVSVTLSVLNSDLVTFTNKIRELNYFYEDPYPHPNLFTLTRFNLVVKLLHGTDADFHAELGFLVGTHWGRYWEQFVFIHPFTASDVVKFLLPQPTSDMEEAHDSQLSKEECGLHKIIACCENKLSAYIKEEGLDWNVQEFLDSAKDKWGRNTVFLVTSRTVDKLVEDITRKQVIYEAFAYLWSLLDVTERLAKGKMNKMFANVSCSDSVDV